LVSVATDYPVVSSENETVKETEDSLALDAVVSVADTLLAHPVPVDPETEGRSETNSVTATETTQTLAPAPEPAADKLVVEPVKPAQEPAPEAAGAPDTQVAAPEAPQPQPEAEPDAEPQVAIESSPATEATKAEPKLETQNPPAPGEMIKPDNEPEPQSEVKSAIEMKAAAIAEVVDEPASVVEAAPPASAEPEKSPETEKIPEPVHTDGLVGEKLSETEQKLESPAETTIVSTENPEKAEIPEATETLSSADQIQKAEHEIDDVMSVSLIHTDSSEGQHRLPDPPAEEKSTEDEPGVDFELGGLPKESDNDDSKEDGGFRPVGHHGIKVIQPLEPIVPIEPEIAEELAKLNHEISATVAPTRQVPEVDSKVPEETSKPDEPVVSVEAAKPAHAPVAEIAAAPVVSALPDVDLPQAESLAADEVAKARTEQTPVQLAPQVPKPELIDAIAPVKAEAPIMVTALPEDAIKIDPAIAPETITEQESDPAPKEQPVAEPVVPDAVETPKEPAPAQTEATPNPKPSSKRRHRLGRRNRDERPLEEITSKSEKDHNEPSEAAQEAAPLTGTLILPTGVKPSAESHAVVAEKPKKLAAGEVYVDATGNVIIGE
jgi:hypothetical protein